MMTMSQKTTRTLFAMCVAALGLIAAHGCGSNNPFPSSSANAQRSAYQQSNPAAVQSAVMDFADRYLSAMADAYDKVRAAATTPEGAFAAQQGKLQAGHGALGNAVNPSPLGGLMDMAILVTLTRSSTEDPWAREAFGPDGVTTIIAALKTQESDIWRIVGSYLTDEQVAELLRLAVQWRQDHPSQRYVAGVRLAAFPQASKSDIPGSRLADSVFGIIRLDPFNGLDPAVRQVEQSRVLAERMFFYVRHMSGLMSWQADGLYTQMLAAPQVKQVLGDTSRFTDNTGKFSDATRIFSDASAQLAKTIEKFRAEIPQQRSAAIEQLDAAVARQRTAALKQADDALAIQRDAVLKQSAAALAVEREAALKQAAAAITVERDAAFKQAGAEIAAQRQAAIEQLNTTIVAQQNIMTQNLLGVMDRSIDRLYERARSLVLITLGGIVGVILIYCLVAAPLLRRIKQ